MQIPVGLEADHDGVVDLVSSGSTLKMNGLRSVGPLLASQAILVARKDVLFEQLEVSAEVVDTRYPGCQYQVTERPDRVVLPGLVGRCELELELMHRAVPGRADAVVVAGYGRLAPWTLERREDAVYRAEDLEKKDKEDWTAGEAADYAKHCVM